MNRIEQVLRTKVASGGRGFIPFITAGDPDADTSAAIAVALSQAGADVIELGVPFSDPMADGPTIQRSSQRALDAGTTIGTVIEIAGRVRSQCETPIVLFSYLNPLLRLGIAEFGRKCAESGIEGLLMTDVVDEEADEIAATLASNGVALIRLVAPTTSDARLENICRNAEGFIYAVSRAGVTGAQASTSLDAERLVTRVRQFTDVPVAVGFGISTRQQVSGVWKYADAAIVGSAIVAEIERCGSEDAAEPVREFAAGLLP